MRIHPYFRTACLLIGALLLMGAIAKKQDPIVNTQTDPIDYKEKQKEEKEGKKGPPAPFINLFPKQRFLTEGPVHKTKKPPRVTASQDELWFEEEAKKPAEGKDQVKPELEKDDI